MNNYEGWHHIGTAPKNKEVLVWDGRSKHVAKCDVGHSNWVTSCNVELFNVSMWRGCPRNPESELPEDED